MVLKPWMKRLSSGCTTSANIWRPVHTHEDKGCCAGPLQAAMAAMHLMLRVVKGLLQVLERDKWHMHGQRRESGPAHQGCSSCRPCQSRSGRAPRRRAAAAAGRSLCWEPPHMLQRPLPSQRQAAAGPACIASMLWHISALTRTRIAAGLSGALLKECTRSFPKKKR